MVEHARIMTATKGILIILGVAATFGILVWLNSPRAAAALEIVASGIFGLELFSRTHSRERWALVLFAFISLLFLLTGLGDFWLFGGSRLFGGSPSDATYRSMMIAGHIVRGIAMGCVIALSASGQLLGRKSSVSTPNHLTSRWS
jgi:hypothetical protein